MIRSLAVMALQIPEALLARGQAAVGFARYALARFSGDRWLRIAAGKTGQFSARAGNGFGDPPGDGSFIGNAHNQPALASHQLFAVTHANPPPSDIIAAIHMVDFAGDGPAQIAEQIETGAAHFINGDIAFQG